MRASAMFRVAAVLIGLFALGHTVGFRQVDPGWGITSVIQGMKLVRFPTQGFTRTYWDFYVGFGLFVTVFLIFAALIAWQLGGMSAPDLLRMRLQAWGLTLAFGAVVLLSWRYFFAVPLVFSAVIFVCLLAGTLLSQAADR